MTQILFQKFCSAIIFFSRVWHTAHRQSSASAAPALDTDTRASDGTRSLSARASKHLNSNSLVASPEARSHYVRHRCGATPAAARSATMHELSGVKRKAHSPSS